MCIRDSSKPVRFRASIPTSWMEIKISQGMNRQVRKMTAAVGYPTLRLVRVAIGKLTLDELQPGESRVLTPEEVRQIQLFAKPKAPYQPHFRKR